MKGFELHRPRNKLHEGRDRAHEYRIKLEMNVLLEASSWENIRPTGILELTFSFKITFTGVRRFYKQNVRDVPQAIEQLFVDPQERDRKSVELEFLGF